MNPRLFRLLFAGWLGLCASTAAASEPDLFGFGARSSAMGGTGAADAEGYDATYLNPAGLIGPARRRLTVGYIWGREQLRLDGTHRPIDDTSGVIIGAELPLPFGGILRDRVAIGLGFYFPTGLINRVRDAFPGEARLALLDDRTQVVSVLVGAGIKLHRRVTIGGGVLALAALIGDISIRPDASGRIITVAEEQLVASFAPVVGMRVQPVCWLKLGATFRGESRSNYNLQIKNSLGNAVPISIPTLRIAGTAQYDPMQLALEGAFTLGRHLRIDLGATWKHWSAYDNPVKNASDGAPPLPPPGYHDTAVPRLGLELPFGSGKLTLLARLGYFFEWSPAPVGPERTLLDADRHVTTAGGGLGWHGPLFSYQLDFFGQWHHLTGNPRATGNIGVVGATFGIDL